MWKIANVQTFYVTIGMNAHFTRKRQVHRFYVVVCIVIFIDKWCTVRAGSATSRGRGLGCGLRKWSGWGCPDPGDACSRSWAEWPPRSRRWPYRSAQRALSNSCLWRIFICDNQPIKSVYLNNYMLIVPSFLTEDFCSATKQIYRGPRSGARWGE